MKRTTVVLPDDLAALVERERQRQGVSAAALVRAALRAYVGEQRRPLAIAALGRSGERNVAREAEAILAREWTYERVMGVDEPARGVGSRARDDAPARDLIESAQDDESASGVDERRGGSGCHHSSPDESIVGRDRPD